ncbi:MAG: hypothetical protein IT455_11045, partial [Planctomycetes bacterium]|nr:hypothetical protein [Planctomycetota bacterium]
MNLGTALLRLEPLAWAILCAAVYLTFGADAFYKTDGIDIVRLLDDHLNAAPGALWPHPWHPGYLPLLAAFRRVLGWIGLHPG